MRIYLVVIDGTAEAEVALRFAARRAAKTGGGVIVMTVIEKVEFVAFGGAQATMEAEARETAETTLAQAISAIADTGVTPDAVIENGEPIAAIHRVLAENPAIAALVLAAASNGPPGPLVSHFAGHDAGNLPCPLMIVPGIMSAETLERIS